MDETYTLQFDGGSRGNPGPAGIGIVVSAADGTPLVTLGRFIGRATNNVAEYRALITAMVEAKKLGAKKILIRGDSELVIKQMKGEYRVKNPDMKMLYDEAQELISQFDHAKIERALVSGIEPHDRCGNRFVHVGDSLEHAFAQEARVVAIAQFDGFVFASGRPRRHSGAAKCSAFKNDVSLHSRISARIDDLPAMHPRDFRRHAASWRKIKIERNRRSTL